MTSPQNNPVPKNVNLLSCQKQWWKVCFLHGNRTYQENYYRHLYARNAARRNANFRGDGEKAFTNSEIIFPIKLADYRLNNRLHNDQFLFGVNEANENGSDSGIDANCSKTCYSEGKNDAESYCETDDGGHPLRSHKITRRNMPIKNP